MIEFSPIVPIEPRAMTIPTFNLYHQSILSYTRPSYTNTAILKTSSDISSQTSISCKCPHVLISDDDPFQAFYYQTLFQRSLDFKNLSIQKENFRIKIFKSGEDLLNGFLQSKLCSCQAPLLVISDYSMGPNKLNGVDTISKLRSFGYKGQVILRTSETEESLRKHQKNLGGFLQDKTVNCLLEKSDHRKTKETIETILQEPASSSTVN